MMVNYNSRAVENGGRTGSFNKSAYACDSSSNEATNQNENNSNDFYSTVEQLDSSLGLAIDANAKDKIDESA